MSDARKYVTLSVRRLDIEVLKTLPEYGHGTEQGMALFRIATAYERVLLAEEAWQRHEERLRIATEGGDE